MKTLKTYIFFIFGFALLFGCKQDPSATSLKYYSVNGVTMGTYYSIKYSDLQKRNLKPQIDSILIAINQSLSTYIPNSYISKVNSAPDKKMSTSRDQHFINNYNGAKKVYEKTNGLYDPTIGAMTNYYGFGKDRRVLRENIPPSTLDSLKTLVGMDRFQIRTLDEASQITKSHPNMQIDFSSIAKGYAVDVISNYLYSHGMVT